VKPLQRQFFPVVLSIAAAVACYAAAGPSLDFFLGTVLLAAIITPPLILRNGQEELQWTAAATIVIASAICWTAGGVSLFAWFQCTLVLMGFVAVLTAAATLLLRLGVSSIIAVAMCVAISLAWLTWPIWASSALRGHAIIWPVAIHPLFAINSACRDLGIWTEQRVAYRLTNMGQDVTYQLPATVLPCAAVQIITAAALMLFCRFTGPKREG
jgi:hypothetical protein